MNQAHTNPSQTAQILAYMQNDWLTPFEALAKFQCLGFGQRIHEIRKIVPLEEKWMRLENGKKVKAFKVAK